MADGASAATTFVMTPSTPQARFESLGLTLPPAPKPLGLYKPCVVAGSWVQTSGHLPVLPDGSLMKGRVGVAVDADAGKQAARQAGLAIVASLVAAFGSLDRIRRVVKVVGLVNAAPDFHKHPAVVNGCSELFAEIWGPDLGVGARIALGAGGLPEDVTVEIEAVFELA